MITTGLRAVSVFTLVAAAASCGDNNFTVDAALDTGTPAALQIDRSSHAFDPTVLGQTSAPTTFTLTNTGESATGMLGIALGGTDTGSFTHTSTCAAVLDAGASCEVTVSFVPQSSGAKTAQLDASANPGGAVSATLTGTGIATGALTVTTSTTALGSVLVGATGTTVATVTVTNTGGIRTGALTVQAAGADPVDAITEDDDCSGEQLDPQASCTFEVRLRPLSRGSKQPAYQISAGPGGTVIASFTGIGLGPASLVIVPQHHGFGSVVVGDTGAALSFAITNTGDVPSGALTQTLSSDQWTIVDTCAGTVLGAGASCVASLAFAPTTVGAKAGMLSMSADPGGADAATLTGTAITAGALTIDPSAHVFANTNVGATSSSQSFTITNTGATATGPLVTSITGTNANAFPIIAGGDNCDGASLAPAGSCTVTLAFAPAGGGNSTATLHVASATSSVASDVSGIGVSSAALVLTPPSRSFGSIAVGSQSAALAFTLTNTGGQASTVPAVSLSGTNSAAFLVAANACTAALGPNQSCTISIRFAPGALGAATASLDVTATSGGTDSAALDGTSVPPGQLLIVPSAYPFPPVALGDSVTAPMTVINTGSAATGTIAVAATAEFSVTHTCTTLAAGASCPLTVTFTPTAAGARTGTLTASATPGGTATAALSGVALPRLELISINLGPVVDPFDFGTVAVNTSNLHQVRITVRNNTAAQQTLALSNTFAGHYSVIANSCPTSAIPASDTCTIYVRFRPTTTGTHAGALTLSIGAGATEQVTQNLTGIGIDALVLVADDGTSFGAVPINTTSAALTFRLINPPGAETTGTVATNLVGAGFAITTNGCTGATLVGGASCTIAVAVSPTTVGALTATLSATASPGGAPTLALSANAVDPVGAAPTDILLTPSSIAENMPVGSTVGGLTTTDADASDTFTYALVTGTGDTDNDAFTIAGANVVTAAPLDFETQAAYSIRVRTTDSGGNVLEEAIAITVTNVDESPVANDDAATIVEDSPATAIDVLANDTDVDGGTKLVLSVTQGNSGSVAITGGGTGVTYLPDPNFTGTDVFSYTLNGGSIALVTVTVTAIDDPPIAVDDTFTVDEDEPTSLDVLANDTDADAGPISIAAVLDVMNGTAQIIANEIVFTPTPNFTGTTTLRYQLAPGSSTATVTIEVGAADDPPVAVADSVTVDEDETTTLLVLANDTDVDGGPITIASVVQPAQGTVTIINGGAAVSYTPPADFFNNPPGTTPVTFTYTLDGGSTASVSVLVTNVDDLPVAVDDTFTIAEDSPATTLDVLANDTDIDGGPMLIELVVNPANGSVTLSGTTLQYTPNPDYCNNPPGTTLEMFSYRLNGDDTGQITIRVDCVNDAPSDIALSNATVDEGQASGVIGTFSTTDVDDTTHTYTLVAGAGSTDNGSFGIAGDQLQVTSAFDFNVQQTASIRVRSTDAGGANREEVFVITIINTNDPPTDMALSNSTVAENQPTGTAVGTLSATDPDAGDTFTFTLVAGAGSTSNALFAIAGNQLSTNAALDFETASSHSIRVRVTDAANDTYEEVFTITVTNANEAPTDLSLDQTSIPEDISLGATVGSFMTIDPDGGAHTYTLVAGTGSTDNAAFAIAGGNLVTATTFDAETKTSYAIRVRTTDAGALLFERQFTITVTNVNEAPTDITITSASVAENQAAGADVGQLAAVDPDAGTHTFALATGAGDADNGSFTVTSAGLVETAASFNFEADSSYTIRVRATDGGGLFFEEQFAITVTNVNEAPTDLALSPSSVVENAAIDTVVGALTTTDPDAGNTFTYTLVAGAGSTDNASFNISGGNLRTSAIFDFEADSSYQIRVRTTDQNNLTYEEALTVTITNGNEAPTDITLTPSTVAEGLVINTVVGALTTADPDAGAHTYTLVAGAGSTDNASFNISGGNLRTSAIFDLETKSSYSIRVRSTDSTALFFEEQLTITVTNVNEAPTDITITSSSVAENQAAGADVGQLAAVEIEADTHAFALATGAGDADNASFTVSPSGLVETVATFNFEADSSYSIRVRATDSGGLLFEKQLTITITDVNEAPTDLALSPSSVAEGAAVNTVVGALTSTDPDAGSTFTYTLVSGTGSTDNASFNISGGSLRTSAIFDEEVDNSYQVRVRTTDAAGLFYEEALTITITSINEAPTAIGLSPSSVPESSAVNTVVGAFSTTDPDGDVAFTYSLVAGVGDTNNSSFNINAGNLRTSAVFDFETQNSFSIRVRTTDAGGASFEQMLAVTVTNVNEAPVDPDEGPITTQANVGVTGNLLVGASDPEGSALSIMGAPFTAATTQGGSIAVAANGAFTYTPQAGDRSIADSFAYTVTDGGLTNGSTVTFAVDANAVWFVDLAAGVNGSGTLASPFNSLAPLSGGSAELLDTVGDAIVLYTSTNATATTSPAATFVLENGQKLIGEGVLGVSPLVTINAIAGFTTHPNSAVLVDLTNNEPTIDTSGIQLGNNNVLHGFEIGGVGTGTHLTGVAFGTLSIASVDISGAGRTLNLTAGTIQGTTAGSTATFSTLSSTSSTSQGLRLQGVVGTISAAGSIAGASSTAVFVDTGPLVLTYSGNVTQATAGQALVLVAAGHTGTLTFQAGTLSATDGTGIQFDNADGTYNFNGTTTLNGGDAGVDVFNGSSGTVTFAAGTSITNPSGIAYREDSSSGNVSFGGTITKTNNATTAIQINAKAAGTTTFSNDITASTSTANAINLALTGGTVNFTDTLTLTTTSGRAFNASGAGTVSASGGGSVLSAATGRALSVVTTSIGAADLVFQSISANNGLNGIVLSDTGVSGGLTVTGNGGSCTVATPTCTGGTIQNTNGGDDGSATPTGTGIVLDRVRGGVSLTRMRLNSISNYAIRGTTVVGFSLIDSLVDGTQGTSTAFDDSALYFSELTGAVALTSTHITGGFTNQVWIANTAGTLNATLSAVTLGSTMNIANDAIMVEGTGTSTTNVTVMGSSFTSAAGDQFQWIADGTGGGSLMFVNNTLVNVHPAIASGGGGVSLFGGAAGPTAITVTGNTMRNAVGNAWTIVKSQGSGSMTGTFANNTVGLAATANSGSLEGSALAVTHAGGGTMDVAISNNALRQYNNYGIGLQTGAGIAVTGTFKASVSGNTLANPGTNGSIASAFQGLYLNSGVTPTDSVLACLTLGANTMVGSGRNGGTDFRVRQRQSTTVRLPGYAGGAIDTAAVVTFVAGLLTGGPTGTASVQVPPGGGFVGTACP